MPLAKIHVVKGRFDCSPNTVDFRARPQLRSGREALRHAPTHDLTPRRQSRTVSQGGRHGRGNETAAGTHAGDPALLGGHAGWRVTAAALRRLPAYVLSAPAVLS